VDTLCPMYIVNCLVQSLLILLQSAKHIFQGLSTTLDAPGSHHGKQGNAALSGLLLMTPHTITYVAIQVSINVSSI